jgi:protein phosphatase
VITDRDDDDTIPTERTEVLAELAGELATPLSVRAFGAATSPGLRRRVNEDSWGRVDDVFVLADGLGGRGGGALAARTAVDAVLRAIGAGVERPHVEWRALVERVNDQVIRVGREYGLDRLGCTLIAAVVAGPLVTLVHLGDSRAYRLTYPAAGEERRAPRLDRLTDDHNIRSELLAAGLDVGEYRDRGVATNGLTSYLGLEREVLRIDVLAVPMRGGDRLLLCTDGVHRQLPDDALRGQLQAPTCADAAAGLVDRADAAGGRDNATALVLEIGTASETSSRPGS